MIESRYDYYLSIIVILSDLNLSQRILVVTIAKIVDYGISIFRKNIIPKFKKSFLKKIPLTVLAFQDPVQESPAYSINLQALQDFLH